MGVLHGGHASGGKAGGEGIDGGVHHRIVRRIVRVRILTKTNFRFPKTLCPHSRPVVLHGGGTQASGGNAGDEGIDGGVHHRIVRRIVRVRILTKTNFRSPKTLCPHSRPVVLHGGHASGGGNAGDEPRHGGDCRQ